MRCCAARCFSVRSLPATSSPHRSISAPAQQGSRAARRDNIPEDLFRMFFEQPAFGLQEIRLRVISTMPRGVVQIAQDTEIELLPEFVESEEPRRSDVTYDDIGGLGDTIHRCAR